MRLSLSRSLLSSPFALFALTLLPLAVSRAGLKMVLSDSYARLCRVTRAGKKSSRTSLYALVVRDRENCAGAGKTR